MLSLLIMEQSMTFLSIILERTPCFYEGGSWMEEVGEECYWRQSVMYLTGWWEGRTLSLSSKQQAELIWSSLSSLT